MKQLPGLPTVEEWIADMEAIAARTDLTQDQKVALVEQKMKDYKEKQRLLLDAEEQRRAELRKSMSPVEQAFDELGWVFERGVREGRILIKPFPVYDQEVTEGQADEGKK